MNKRKMAAVAANLPPYCVYPEDFQFSDDWANQLIHGWCGLKRQQVAEGWSAERFTESLIDLVIEKSGGWKDEFRQAASDEGVSFDCVSYEVEEAMYKAYVDANRRRAFDLIPNNLYGELCWVPGWDGADLDDLIYRFGQRSTRYNSNYIEDVMPERWLIELLKLGNCSSHELRAYCAELGTPGAVFIQRTAAMKWRVESDPLRPRILSPENVVGIIENGYPHAVPMAHCEINVRALFEHDPKQPMLWSTKRDGKVHIGLHDPVLNGAGYMDAYDGVVRIAPDEVGFAGSDRWNWSVNAVYGIVKSYFRTFPVTVCQIKEVA